MVMADGSHVKIGDYFFELEETVDAGSGASGNLYNPHYKYNTVPLFGRSEDIAGTEDHNLRANRLLWYFDDWSGGENNRTYYKDDGSVYDFSYGLNPRIRGQVTGRPARAAAMTTLVAERINKRPCTTVSQSKLWVLGSRSVFSTVDTVSWTTYGDTAIGLNSLSASYDITAATGDSEKLYYSAWHSGSSGSRVTMAMVDGSNAAAIESQATNKAPYAGLTIMNGFLYAWTGRKLFKMDVTQSYPLSAAYITKVGDTTVDPASTNVFGTTWWGNAVTAESSVFTFYTTDNQSTVYEFREEGGFGPLWNAPLGFSIKSMQYNNGVLYIGGHWGGDSNMRGRGVLYAMPLDTRRPEPVGFFRKQNNQNLEMQEMCSSYGNQILIAASHTGRIFVYDADLDSISMLDSMATSGSGDAGEDSFPQSATTDSLAFVANDQRIGDMVTYGTKRFVVLYQPGSSGQGYYPYVTYDDDEPINRQAGTSTNAYESTLQSGDYDYDIPFEQKVLYGFDVTYKPLTTGQSFKVEYQLDNSGSWTQAGSTQTSASADAAKGRTFLQVSTAASTVKFFSMRTRLTVTGTRTSSTNRQPPIILGLATEALMTAYEETWELLVRLKDPQARQRAGKSSTTMLGSKKRQFLRDTCAAKNVITFLDGYFYQPNLKGKYVTNTVTIEEIEDIIVRAGEGTMRVKLRSVPT